MPLQPTRIKTDMSITSLTELIGAPFATRLNTISPVVTLFAGVIVSKILIAKKDDDSLYNGKDALDL